TLLKKSKYTFDEYFPSTKASLYPRGLQKSIILRDRYVEPPSNDNNLGLALTNIATAPPPCVTSPVVFNPYLAISAPIINALLSGFNATRALAICNAAVAP